MKWEEAIDEAANQGAIRVWEASKGWALVYRLRQARWEVRNLVRVGTDDWEMPEKVVGAKLVSRDGWTAVSRIHHRAQPIANIRAEKNKGYYLGLERRCETCKQIRTADEFERQELAEGRFRTWECNSCAAERRRELGKYRDAGRVGDVVRRATHVSRPPVESEI